MKSQILSLMLCAAVLTTSPAFAMDDPNDYDSSKGAPKGLQSIVGAYSFSYNPMHGEWKMETNHIVLTEPSTQHNTLSNLNDEDVQQTSCQHLQTLRLLREQYGLYQKSGVIKRELAVSPLLVVENKGYIPWNLKKPATY